MDKQVLASKAVVALASAYLLYVGITCPCRVVYSCHLTQLYVALAIIVAVFVFNNGLRFTSYH